MATDKDLRRRRSQDSGGGKQEAVGLQAPAFEPNAAGIDIGAREIFVAVPPDRDGKPVRSFGTFTSCLDEAAGWMKRCGVTTAAMESTGVYWIPVYDALERHGIVACLVDPRGMRNVPGKRTDFHECQWIQHLHSMGLLRAAFRPDAAVCAVRTLMRHRNDMVGMASQHVQHMQKALTQMNVQFQHVISDITGLTGLAVIDAILEGERDPTVLAELRDPRIKADRETIAKSLEGNWLPEHLLVLKQRLSLYRSDQAQIAECDLEINKLVAAFEPRADPEVKPMPEDRKKKQRRSKAGADPGFDMRTEAYKLFGVDLTQVPGLMAVVLMLFSELGRDMSRWPTASHFVSWLGLCPDNDISGGRVLWRGPRRTKNRAGTLFRLAAQGLHRHQSRMGDYLRRMKAKLGPAGATTATAHKIAVIFYTMVKNQVEYDESLWGRHDAIRDKRIEKRLHMQAAQRGYKLVPIEPDKPVSNCGTPKPETPGKADKPPATQAHSATNQTPPKGKTAKTRNSKPTKEGKPAATPIDPDKRPNKEGTPKPETPGKADKPPATQAHSATNQPPPTRNTAKTRNPKPTKEGKPAVTPTR